ncbi:hypothetical protein CVT24_013067 [Panaeolus cyanescens]|uniref:F-box domain-containing protein n=1 Tax=Panaeolus cyanescens TaxID=181874 RepID=A0A409YUW7_9AGAR|nr:hypothetical protein CVT24_013067 [Panaeolus cyanescens]
MASTAQTVTRSLASQLPANVLGQIFYQLFHLNRRRIIDFNYTPCYFWLYVAPLDEWQMPTEKDTDYRSMFPYNVAGVCKKWFKIVKPYPEFWDRLVLQLNGEVDGVDGVDLGGFPRGSGVTLDQVVPLACTRVKADVNMLSLYPASPDREAGENQTVAAMIQLLNPHLKRCARVNLYVTFASSIHVAVHTFAFKDWSANTLVLRSRIRPPMHYLSNEINPINDVDRLYTCLKRLVIDFDMFSAVYYNPPHSNRTFLGSLEELTLRISGINPPSAEFVVGALSLISSTKITIESDVKGTPPPSEPYARGDPWAKPVKGCKTLVLRSMGGVFIRDLLERVSMTDLVLEDCRLDLHLSKRQMMSMKTARLHNTPCERAVLRELKSRVRDVKKL